MIPPIKTALLFEPTEQFVEAVICPLTPAMIDAEITAKWWREVCLKKRLSPVPIDRQWDWNAVCIEYDGRILPSQKIAVVTGDTAVQGVMLISTEPVASVVEPSKQALFVELLFTAPRNRRNLRRDGRNYFVGVGTELLCWAVTSSQRGGCEGRIKLDGSPDFLGWYGKRGLMPTGEPNIIFEGTSYTPMELPATAAKEMLRNWRPEELP